MSPPLRRPYRTVFFVVFALWGIAALASMIFAWLGTRGTEGVSASSLSGASVGWIALASGMVSFAAMMPGCSILIPDSRQQDIPAAPGANPASEAPPVTETESGASRLLSPWALAIEQLGQAFLLGMIIRIVGTVALFLLCSYVMQASRTHIGIWILAWHLVLLSAEVIALSRQFRLTESPQAVGRG